MITDIAIGTGELGFDYRAGHIGRNVSSAVVFLRSCVVQALSGGDGYTFWRMPLVQ